MKILNTIEIQKVNGGIAPVAIAVASGMTGIAMGFGMGIYYAKSVINNLILPIPHTPQIPYNNLPLKIPNIANINIKDLQNAYMANAMP